jgi:hypothetical protein
MFEYRKTPVGYLRYSSISSDALVRQGNDKASLEFDVDQTIVQTRGFLDNYLHFLGKISSVPIGGTLDDPILI